MPGGRMGMVGAHLHALAASNPYGPAWDTVAWLGDPAWANPGNGNPIDVIRNAGTRRTASTTATKIGPTGLIVPSGNQLAGKVAHAAAMNVIDVDFACRIKFNDWTPGTNPRGIVEKRYDNSAGFSWEFALKLDGRLQALFTENGTTALGFDSTAAVTATDGDTLWLRCTIDADNGASGATVTFYQAPDNVNIPSSWTQIGTPVVLATARVIYNSTHPMSFGTAGVVGNAYGIDGVLIRAVQWDGIGSGTKVYDIDFQQPADTGKFIESGPNGYTVEVRSNADLSQFTLANQPLFSATGGVNGQPAVIGDGVNDVLQSATISVAQPYSMIVIENAAPSNKIPMDAAAASSSGWMGYPSGGTKWQAQAGTVLSEPGTTATNAAHAIRFLANGANSRINVDGVTKVTGAGGSNAATKLSICASGSNFATTAPISFAGFYAGDITADPQWPGFVGWVLATYGLTIG